LTNRTGVASLRDHDPVRTFGGAIGFPRG